jgi:signal transduction histidine kinase
MGLSIINERAASIKASVHVESEADSGTTFLIEWAKNGLH